MWRDVSARLSQRGEQGNSAAEVNLAWCHFHGKGVEGFYRLRADQSRIRSFRLLNAAQARFDQVVRRSVNVDPA